MRAFMQRPNATRQTASAKSTKLGRADVGQGGEMNSILHLQRTIGNQAVKGLIGGNTLDVEGDSTTTEIARFGHDFSRIPVNAEVPVKTQTNLTVNTPGDEYEREADRIADQVRATPAHHAADGAARRSTGQRVGRAARGAAAGDGRPLRARLRREPDPPLLSRRNGLLGERRPDPGQGGGDRLCPR